jgi:hypoxanthine phosphoribosyltransferase
MPLTKAELNRIRSDAEELHSPEQIHAALDRMAEEITATLADTQPVVLCVLTGGIIPTGHLLTRLAFPLESDYLHATRYRGDTSGKEVQWVSEPGISLSGRTVLVVDDILDEGHTLTDIIRFCTESGAEHIYSAVLIQKRHDRRDPAVQADFVGLEVDDRYVFGFGMDYKGYLRNLNGIFALGDGG